MRFSISRECLAGLSEDVVLPGLGFIFVSKPVMHLLPHSLPCVPIPRLLCYSTDCYFMLVEFLPSR